MGLIYTATSGNRIVQQAPTVTYSVSKIQQSYTIVTGNIETTQHFVYEYRRFCTAQYSYVGMDYDSALEKQNQLIDMYTRSFKISDWNSNTGNFIRISGGKRLMGSVSVNKTVGHLYQIDVQVNEEDSILKKTGNLSPSILFSEENNRQYEV